MVTYRVTGTQKATSEPVAENSLSRMYQIDMFISPMTQFKRNLTITVNSSLVTNLATLNSRNIWIASTLNVISLKRSFQKCDSKLKIL